MFTEVKDDGGGGDNWTTGAISRAKLQSNHYHQQTNIQFFGGAGIRGLMRGMATLPQGNHELLVVRDKVGRPPGELGVSTSMECDIFPRVL